MDHSICEFHGFPLCVDLSSKHLALIIVTFDVADCCVCFSELGFRQLNMYSKTLEWKHILFWEETALGFGAHISFHWRQNLFLILYILCFQELTEFMLYLFYLEVGLHVQVHSALFSFLRSVGWFIRVFKHVIFMFLLGRLFNYCLWIKMSWRLHFFFAADFLRLEAIVTCVDIWIDSKLGIASFDHLSELILRLNFVQQILICYCFYRCNLSF